MRRTSVRRTGPARAVTFDALAAGLVWIVLAALACLSPAQSDTWWQLRAGRQLVATRRVPSVDTWSWTARGRPWPDHESGWQLLAFGLHALGGMPLLSLANGAAAVGALWLATRVGPRRQTPAATALLVVAALGISSAWALRPQVASLLCLAGLLVLLVRERYGWLVPLFVVWANLHGAVAIGGVVLVAALVCALAVRRRDADSARRVRRLAMVVPLCALATLATPLGVHLWGYLLASVGRGRSATRLGLVQEWQSALHLTPVTVVFWLWAVGLLALLARHASRARAWPALVPVASAVVLALLAVTSVRLVPFFLLAALPATLLLLPVPTRAPDVVRLGRPALVTAGALAVAAVSLAYVDPPPRLGWQPVTAAARAAISTCGGPVYNSYDEGGPLLWFAPGTRVFVDSRLDPYPLPFLRQVATVEVTGRAGTLLQRYPARCAVVTPGSAMQGGLRAAGWTTSYADAELVVLRRP